MVAMVVLLDLCLRARTIAASMVIEGPEATDGAPLPGVPIALARWGGRWGSTAKEGLSCLARNDGALGVPTRLVAWGGGPAGEESFDAAVAP
ncbi:hypothetical protein B1812_16860 [Methylocystis bryophila]|uniref:Uncharacterized protein n=1 Tax=Methylocystis bryophila TaxID=655015 RepID=A0A1W6MY27_9HYPH|nr:hypothetical protein B1812_16860 [Methylocystis bryophila]